MQLDVIFLFSVVETDDSLSSWCLSDFCRDAMLSDINNLDIIALIHCP